MARIVRLLVAFLLLGAVPPGCTPNPTDHAAPANASPIHASTTEQPAPPLATGLNALFDRLSRTKSAEEASRIQLSIHRAWSRSTKPEAEKLMTWAGNALQAGDMATAASLLNQVIEMAPDMVAAWNLRATVHYAQDDYAAALADIAQTLTLEPRHYGAWAGMGLIFQDLGYDAAALHAFEIALALNPHLEGLQDSIESLRTEVRGLAI